MMAVNRYRLKHQADSGNAAAQRVLKLLENPTIATIIGLRLFGDIGIAIATGALIIIVLIFAEVAPKTLAAQFPEKIAFPSSWLLLGLQRVLKPLILMVNFFANNILRLFGVKQASEQNALNIDELRAAVLESSNTKICCSAYWKWTALPSMM